VSNLVANAVRHAPEGSAVEVHARRTNGHLRIDVIDRGKGVAPEVKGVLFEKFSTLRSSSGAGRGGYGLGLYLVKLVAEAHGGTVALGDPEGGGAMFSLLFPQPVGAIS
jgi:signal transduction histidine kinase